jgi:hypothetical protein
MSDHLKTLTIVHMIHLLLLGDVKSQLPPGNKKISAPSADATAMDHGKLRTLIEEYLNAINTITAEFEEQNSDGISDGRFFMKRINGIFALKMACKSSHGKVVLIKNNRFIQYDRALKEKTETTVYSSPMAFLLEKTLNLKEIKILSVVEKDNKIIVTFCKASGDNEGAIRFIFQREQLLAKRPGAIEQWVIFKNKNNLTSGNVTVTLKNQKYASIANEEFEQCY